MPLKRRAGESRKGLTRQRLLTDARKTMPGPNPPCIPFSDSRRPGNGHARFSAEAPPATGYTRHAP